MTREDELRYSLCSHLRGSKKNGDNKKGKTGTLLFMIFSGRYRINNYAPGERALVKIHPDPQRLSILSE